MIKQRPWWYSILGLTVIIAGLLWFVPIAPGMSRIDGPLACGSLASPFGTGANPLAGLEETNDWMGDTRNTYDEELRLVAITGMQNICTIAHSNRSTMLLAVLATGGFALVLTQRRSPVSSVTPAETTSE